MTKKERFESLYPAIQIIINKRKASWYLTNLEWEDVVQILTIRLWEKFDLYEPERGPLENWCNTVISNALTNLLRDNLFKHARPCITAGSSGGACIHNLGGNACAWTKSGVQCSECPLYANWKKKKEIKFNISSTLSLENHIDEAHSMQNDMVDVEKSKKIIDERILAKLNPYEAQIYRMLYIEHLSLEEIGKKMKYKTQKNSNIAGYQTLRKLSKKFQLMAVQIIRDENLA